MTITVLKTARADLSEGYRFYEGQEPGLGDYFLQSIYLDLKALGRVAGIHRKMSNGSHRMIAHRFPYAIYQGVVEVSAIIDCRRSPEWIKQRLK